MSAVVHAMLGTVQYQLGPHPAGPAEDDPYRQAAPPGAGLAAYAEALAGLAAAEVAGVDLAAGAPQQSPADPGRSRVALAESAVVGMVLHERVLIALRRLAQEDASARYFG
jgi:hypothetical protein